MVHVALDSSVLASWILYDAYLHSDGETGETDRNKPFRDAYHAVELLLSSPVYRPLITPLILAEVAQVILRERLLILAYREGIPFRRLLSGRTLYEEKYESLLTRKEREEIRSFLEKYVIRLVENGGVLLHTIPSEKYLLYLILHDGLDTHDAYILATLVEDADLSMILTLDVRLRRRKPFMRIRFTNGSEGKDTPEERVIRLLTPREFLEKMRGE